MNATSNPFALPPLPYDQSALAPTISAQTMGFHYGKHHLAYVNKLNELVQGTDYAGMSLEDVVQQSHKKADQAIFNNAGQHWNHSFFWKSLSPKKTEPHGKLLDAINRDFGGVEKFNEAFAQAGVAQFGSGWAWLVSDKGALKIEKTPNAMTPMAEGRICLLTIDVWEHAYYLDYQNRRPDFLKAVLSAILNWDFAAENYGA
jgi:Fe-Mn family superoxide dismutase